MLLTFPFTKFFTSGIIAYYTYGSACRSILPDQRLNAHVLGSTDIDEAIRIGVRIVWI